MAEPLPPPPPIRLPVWYAIPWVVTAIAYVYDLTVGGAASLGDPRRSTDRFALIIATCCAIEAFAAFIYLLRRRYVSAAIILIVYLLIFASVAITFRTFIR